MKAIVSNRRTSLLALASMLALALLATSSGGFSAQAATVPAPIAGQGYNLVFDEDNWTSLSSNWHTTLWWYESGLPSNSVYVQNGVLNLVSRRSQGYKDISVSTESAPSGGHWKQGYFEARLRWTGGAGAWPAFWLFSQAHADKGNPAQCPTLTSELDILEGQGTEPNMFYGTLHRNTEDDKGFPCGIPDQQNANNYHQQSFRLADNWHTYAALWDSAQVCWYIDDGLSHCTPTYDSTNQDMFLILYMWIGGWANGTAPTPRRRTS